MRSALARWLRAWADRLAPPLPLHFSVGRKVDRVWIDGRAFVPFDPPQRQHLTVEVEVDKTKFDAALEDAKRLLREFRAEVDAALDLPTRGKDGRFIAAKKRAAARGRK